MNSSRDSEKSVVINLLNNEEPSSLWCFVFEIKEPLILKHSFSKPILPPDKVAPPMLKTFLYIFSVLLDI